MFLGITVAAWASIIGVLIVIGISMYNEDLNIGILAIGFAILVGSIFAGIPSSNVIRSLPVDLVMILIGVCFMFGLAIVNGTLDKLTAFAVRLVGTKTMLIPLIMFLLMTILTTIGPGNIVIIGIGAAVCMPIAGRIGLSAFLMTLIVIGACNGSALSPVAPTGVISTYFVAKMAPALEALGQNVGDVNLLAWKIYFNTMVAQLIGNGGGFLILGGWAWMMKQRRSTLSIDEIAPKPEPFDRNQLITLASMGLLIIVTILPSLPGTKEMFSPFFMTIVGNGKVANIGSVTFLIATGLLLLNAGDSKEAIKAMPWGVILMVGGMGILIDVMDKAGGLNALVKAVAVVSTPTTVNGVLAVVTGVISAYSSSSGVVMPTFLPLVPGLIEQLGGGSAVALISSIDVGAHMVDTSPLSVGGALCIACASDKEDKGALFRNLLIWGLAMSLVGGVICYVCFGLLNL